MRTLERLDKEIYGKVAETIEMNKKGSVTLEPITNGLFESQRNKQEVLGSGK